MADWWTESVGEFYPGDLYLARARDQLGNNIVMLNG